METIRTTLLLIIKDDMIMLAKKKKGFGEGKYNGVGGKLEEGESVEEALIRETKEEINITPLDYEKVGVVSFDEDYKGKRSRLEFHLYTCSKWEGDLKETEEMEPHWFNIKEIPYDEMFPDDKYWLPYLLEGHKFNAYFNFDDDWNIIDKQIDIIS